MNTTLVKKTLKGAALVAAGAIGMRAWDTVSFGNNSERLTMELGLTQGRAAAQVDVARSMYTAETNFLARLQTPGSVSPKLLPDVTVHTALVKAFGDNLNADKP